MGIGTFLMNLGIALMLLGVAVGVAVAILTAFLWLTGDLDDR